VVPRVQKILGYGVRISGWSVFSSGFGLENFLIGFWYEKMPGFEFRAATLISIYLIL